MTVDEALATLHRAIVGEDPEFAHALAAARERSGVPDEEFPEYLPRAIATLAERTSRPEVIDHSDRGAAWLLNDFANLFPSAQMIDEEMSSGLAIPALGRVLMIHRGDEERWEVATWPPLSPSQPRILGTFSPTPDQVREWAYDPSVSFAFQDEDLAITDPIHVDQLISLAADPACPKREAILSILGAIIADYCPGGGPLMAHTRDLARATADKRLVAWAEDLDHMLAYANGHGPVEQDEARAIARIMLLGVRWPDATLNESSINGWWQFRARFSHGDSVDAIYVHAHTGNLFWARRVLTLSELKPYEVATNRTAALGECHAAPSGI